MHERANRWIYAAETILIGAPSMTVCIPLLLVGLAMVGILIANPSHFTWSELPYAALAVAGSAGVIAWLVLSGNFLFGGHLALQAAPVGWWFALAAGILAACCMSAMMLTGGDWMKPMQWLSGPAMAVPAAHLFWLRLR